MDPIDICYTLTLPEFMAACQAHWRAHRQGSLLHLSAGFVGLGIGAYVLTFSQLWGLVFLILSSLLILLTFARSYLCRQGYNQARKYTQSIHVVFSEDNIHVESADGVSDLEWGFYNRFVETPDCILLYMTRRAFSVIPKKAFATAEQQQQFLDLVARKLPPLR